MSNSSLVSVKVPAYSGNYTVGRSGRKIEMVTIHHMAGVLSAEQCGAIFQQKGRYGSSHYGIGNDGKIALYVDESNTAWTNSNWDSNCKAVTIETSNSSNGGNWPVSDRALNSLIKLVADIGKRNNLGTLVKGKNVTWHSMYANTNCPGAYLLSKMDYIIAEANKINSSTPVKNKYKVGDTVSINGLYVSSTSTKKLTPAITKGKITRIVEGARNPYLLDNGNIGWVNDGCIVGSSTTTLAVGTKVRTTAIGNGASDGSSVAAIVGITGTIIKIINGAKYPYLVAQGKTPIGWYQEKALKVV